MTAENGTYGIEADHMGVVPAIQQKCPSFKLHEIYRTPHAGILYVKFEVDNEDLKKICKYGKSSNTFISVHNEFETLVYRFGLGCGYDQNFIDSIT